MRPFYHEGQVPDGDGGQLTLVLNFRALDTIEALTGKPMPDVIPMLMDKDQPQGLIVKVVWALLRAKHEALSMDDVMGLVLNKDVEAPLGAMLGDMLRRAYNIGEAKAKNPPKRRGRSKTS